MVEKISINTLRSGLSWSAIQKCLSTQKVDASARVGGAYYGGGEWAGGQSSFFGGEGKGGVERFLAEQVNKLDA